MQTILGIDPGSVDSAWVLWQPDPPRVLEHGIAHNCQVRGWLRNGWHRHVDVVAIEAIVSSRGMPVGADTFSTVRWTGIFQEAWEADAPESVLLVPRDRVKLHLCGQTKARDSNVRQALIDRFGAPGTKRQPGVLHGLKTHEWQALAVAVTVADEAA